MKSCVFGVIVAAALLLTSCTEEPAGQPTEAAPPTAAPVDAMNAAVVELDGWQLEREPQVVVGDALYELINGGAELYHRYGFVQALAADYADAQGRTLALEVFEMTDADAAAAIFADKTGDTGDPADIGDEAVVESYYLNARTGPYLVTITGFDSDETTTAGIQALARAVVAGLGETP